MGLVDSSKLKFVDVVAMDKKTRREIEVEVREKMARNKMDIYGDKSKFASQNRALKKVLARLLTVRD